MADVSARLPKKLSVDLSHALGAAVRSTGPIETALQRRLKVASDDLERSLKNYDRVAEGLHATTPSQDQIEKVIQDRIPSNYRDKAYKRLFWRTMYQVVPYMKEKKKTEDEINALSKVALTAFSILFRALISYTNIVLQKAIPAGSSPEDLDEKDPEEFDPELDDAISGMEKAIKPSAGKDQIQRKTDQNVKNQQRKSTEAPPAKTEDEFRSFVGQKENQVDACRVAVTRYNEQLTTCLKYSTDRTFSLIQASSIKAVALGQVLNLIVTSSRETLQPGTFVACKGLIATITATNTIVIQSVALNRAQRTEVNKHLKDLQQKVSPQEQPAAEEEESEI
jgi:hypothetical protein